MNIRKLKINKEKLESIPEKERIFFLQIMALLNDTNILKKQVLFAHRKRESQQNKVLLEAQTNLVVCNLIMLAGKLYEGWQMVEKYFLKSKFSNEYNRKLSEFSECKILKDKGKESLKYLKKYFNDKHNLIKQVRNMSAGHYGPAKREEDFWKIRQEEFTLYLQESPGNCFSTTNYILLESILNTINPDFKEGFDNFLRQVIEVAANFQNFIIACLAIIIKIKPYFQEDDFEEIEIPEPQRYEDIFLPFFV